MDMKLLSLRKAIQDIVNRYYLLDDDEEEVEVPKLKQEFESLGLDELDFLYDTTKAGGELVVFTSQSGSDVVCFEVASEYRHKLWALGGSAIEEVRENVHAYEAMIEDESIDPQMWLILLKLDLCINKVPIIHCWKDVTYCRNGW